MPSEDDPYAKYLTKPTDAAPTPSDDPYAKYLTKPGDAVAPAATDEKPWFGVGKGEDKVGEMLRTAIDARTFGGANIAASALGAGTNALGLTSDAETGDAVAAHTRAAAEDLPWQARIGSEIAGYAAPIPGGPLTGGAGLVSSLAGHAVVKGATDAAEGAAARYLPSAIAARAPGVIRGATETGIASGLGAAGHGEDIPSAVVGGALTGGVISGALGGASRNFAPRSTIAPRAAGDLGAESKAGYDTMKAKPVEAKTVGDALQQGYSSLKPDDLTGLSFRFKNQFINIQNAVADLETTGEPTSISAVDRWQRQLLKAANQGRGDADSTAAARIGDALQSIIDGHGMTDVQSAAKLASARAKDMTALEGANAASAPALAAKMLAKRGQLYGANAQEALARLAGLGPQPTMGGSVGGDIKKATGDLLTDKGLGALAGFTSGVPGGTVLFPAAEAGFGVARKAYTRSQINKAIHAAKVAISTGQAVPSSHPIGGLISDVMQNQYYDLNKLRDPLLTTIQASRAGG